MSILVITFLGCDKCGATQDGVFENSREAKQAARAAGWTRSKYGLPADICPACVEV